MSSPRPKTARRPWSTFGDHDAAWTRTLSTTTPRGGETGEARPFTLAGLAAIGMPPTGDPPALRLETDGFASIMFAGTESAIHPAATLNIDHEASSAPLPAAAPMLPAGPAGIALRRRR